jgi:hypothetical protein
MNPIQDTLSKMSFISVLWFHFRMCDYRPGSALLAIQYHKNPNPLASWNWRPRDGRRWPGQRGIDVLRLIARGRRILRPLSNTSDSLTQRLFAAEMRPAVHTDSGRRRHFRLPEMPPAAIGHSPI